MSLIVLSCLFIVVFCIGLSRELELDFIPMLKTSPQVNSSPIHMVLLLDLFLQWYGVNQMAFSMGLFSWFSLCDKLLIYLV